jgi:hypothetical protein
MLPSGVEVLAGLELGGVPLAVVAAQVCGLPTVFVRKTAEAGPTATTAFYTSALRVPRWGAHPVPVSLRSVHGRCRSPSRQHRPGV